MKVKKKKLVSLKWMLYLKGISLFLEENFYSYVFSNKTQIALLSAYYVMGTVTFGTHTVI